MVTRSVKTKREIKDWDDFKSRLEESETEDEFIGLLRGSFGRAARADQDAGRVAEVLDTLVEYVDTDFEKAGLYRIHRAIAEPTIDFLGNLVRGNPWSVLDTGNPESTWTVVLGLFISLRGVLRDSYTDKLKKICNAIRGRVKEAGWSSELRKLFCRVLIAYEWWDLLGNEGWEEETLEVLTQEVFSELPEPDKWTTFDLAVEFYSYSGRSDGLLSTFCRLAIKQGLLIRSS